VDLFQQYFLNQSLREAYDNKLRQNHLSCKGLTESKKKIQDS